MYPSLSGMSGSMWLRWVEVNEAFAVPSIYSMNVNGCNNVGRRGRKETDHLLLDHVERIVIKVLRKVSISPAVFSPVCPRKPLGEMRH